MAVATILCMNPTKSCRECGEVKPLGEFHRDRKAKDGRKPRCKVCGCKATQRWRQRNPDKVEAAKDRQYEYRRVWGKRNRHKLRAYKKQYRETNRTKVRDWNRAAYVRREYGLTVEEYDALLKGPCAICGEHAEHLDHDHRNGKIRTALCRGCNIALGAVHDNPQTLRAAAEYIEAWQREHA